MCKYQINCFTFTEKNRTISNDLTCTVKYTQPRDIILHTLVYILPKSVNNYYAFIRRLNERQFENLKSLFESHAGKRRAPSWKG